MDKDIYFHKTITYRAYGHSLRFITSQELFSSYDIDVGTRFLLRSIVEAGLDKSPRILDLGCGYGPLGLCLKKLNPANDIHMVDRDALAVIYSRYNAQINDLDGLHIYGSLGYDDVTCTDFGLIAANIPGKAGEPVISHLLSEAAYYLAPDGVVAIVVVSPLVDTVAAILHDTPGVDVISRRRRSGHAVFHYRFIDKAHAAEPERNSIERGVYQRDNITVHQGNIDYTVQTAYGLPEFDSLDYRSELLIRALGNISPPDDTNCAVVLNTGQGYTAVALWKILQLRNIHLVDRDLLALRYSHRNLILNKYPADRIRITHGVGFDYDSGDELDLFIGVLREEEGREATFQTVKQAAGKLSSRGKIIVAASSTAVTRLVADLESASLLRITAREKRRGYGCLVLEHR
ncbi:MAG TPA: methyltransferase [Dehalococcoidia bacterium]|nr:methyltransferase [Dehalococcoidia bacterium]